MLSPCNPKSGTPSLPPQYCFTLHHTPRGWGSQNSVPLMVCVTHRQETLAAAQCAICVSCIICKQVWTSHPEVSVTASVWSCCSCSLLLVTCQCLVSCHSGPQCNCIVIGQFGHFGAAALLLCSAISAIFGQLGFIICGHFGLFFWTAPERSPKCAKLLIFCATPCSHLMHHYGINTYIHMHIFTNQHSQTSFDLPLIRLRVYTMGPLLEGNTLFAKIASVWKHVYHTAFDPHIGAHCTPLRDQSLHHLCIFRANGPLRVIPWECHARSAHAVRSFGCRPILRPYFLPLLTSFWFHTGVFLASYAFGMWHI